VNIKRFELLLSVLIATAAIVLVLLAAQSHSVSPGKAMSPPTSSGLESEESLAHTLNLGRFNLSNSSAPTKQEVMRIVRDWVNANATQEEVRLVIALWRNSSSTTASGH
jgi:hypothetical protein